MEDPDEVALVRDGRPAALLHITGQERQRQFTGLFDGPVASAWLGQGLVERPVGDEGDREDVPLVVEHVDCAVAWRLVADQFVVRHRVAVAVLKPLAVAAQPLSQGGAAPLLGRSPRGG